jgi:hypothetical protein
MAYEGKYNGGDGGTMAIYFECANCRAKLKVRNESRRKAYCPKCEKLTLIPAADQSTADSPPSSRIPRQTPEPITAISENPLPEDAPPFANANVDDAPPRRQWRLSREEERDDGATVERHGKPRPKRRRLWPWIVGGLGVFVVLVVVAVVMVVSAAGARMNVAKASAAKYFEAYSQKDWDKAMTLYSVEFFGKTPKEQWRQTLPALADKLGAYQGSQLVGWRYVADTRGNFLVLTYNVQYVSGPATETFTFGGTANGEQMPIFGHHINSPALLAPKK